MKKLICNILIGVSVLGISVSIYGFARQYETFQVLKQVYTSKQERCNQLELYLKERADYQDLDKRYELEINSYDKYFPYYTYKSEFFKHLLNFLKTYPLTELQVTQGEEAEEDSLVNCETYTITYRSKLDRSRALIKELSGLSGMPQIQHLAMSHLGDEQVHTQFDISFRRRKEQ